MHKTSKKEKEKWLEWKFSKLIEKAKHFYVERGGGKVTYIWLKNNVRNS